MRLLTSSRLFKNSLCLRSISTSNVASSSLKSDLKPEYDVVIVGGGHNGLVSAAYLQRAGLSACVLERRHVVGGAAVTEEIVPGFKFSRASYLLSLLRPYIINDLKLKEHGLKFYLREPYHSYTPIRESLWSKFPNNAKSLLMSGNMKVTCEEISKFSKSDAKSYEAYEKKMSIFVNALMHLIDSRPANPSANAKSILFQLSEFKPILQAFREIGLKNLPEFHELLTTSAKIILDKWFESEPLKATLATDALIGTMSGPGTHGTGYVLLHHIMGGIEDKRGAWAYVEGGMGGVSNAISKSATSLGADIFTNMEVANIIVKDTAATGVQTSCGKEVRARKAVFSGTTPHVTFNQLLKMNEDPMVRNVLGEDFVKSINSIDYTSPVTKINVALSRIPNFLADPNKSPNQIQDHHKCSIHINCENMDILEDSYTSCVRTNSASQNPMIEMVIPSSLDPTLTTTPGSHVCLLFTQFTPYSPSDGSWEDPEFKEKYANRVFNVIEEYAPGFKESIVGKEVLTPVDLEKTFNLTGGNIFHGAMSFNQLYWLRPIFTQRSRFPATPIKGLYLCGSGAHPGGGVMGVPGFLASKALTDSKFQ